MVLTPNDLFSWNNKYSKYTVILSHYIHQQWIHFSSSSYSMHVNLLCACWHSEAVKGSSYLSSRRLLISLHITSFLFLCPEPTDAPCPYYEDLAPPSPRWRPHPQGPHTLPFQGPRQLSLPKTYKFFYLLKLSNSEEGFWVGCKALEINQTVC
jgi:hypothetical protein